MKRFLPYILIGAMVLVVIMPQIVRAESWLGVPTLGELVKQGFAWVGYIILTIVSQLVSIAGYLLDASIDYSITNAGAGSLAIVETGWALSRDVANLFFIFILLYIAIATILQLSSYGMKSLLAKLVIIALLVNFSLVITKVIIDSSNVLASEFYSKMKDIKDTSGGTHSLSEALVSGLNPQTLFGVSTPEGEIKLKDNQSATFVQIAIITLFGSGMFLVIAFVLFAAAILFVIRTAVLWILMILAPLAFLFMVLPKTQQYASDWWNKLFNQAFFAPAYLFLLYIVINIISKGTLLEQLEADNKSFGTAFGSPNDANVKLILNFAILIFLLIASLIMAQKMGAVGASTIQGWGKDLKKAGQSYAGRVGKRYVGRAAAYAEEKLEKSEGRFATTLKAVPFLQRGLARGAQLKKKEISAYEKQYAGYKKPYVGDEKTQTLEQLKGKFGTTREAREAMERIIKKEEKEEEENKILATGSSIAKVGVLAKREKRRAEEAEEKLAAKEEKPKEEKPKEEKPKEV